MVGKEISCGLSAKGLRSTKTLAFCGMMAALGVVLSFVATIEISSYIRIGFSEIPNRVIDTFLGPVIGGIFGAALDIIKFVLKPTGPFFIGFTLDAMMGGIIFGLINYRRKVSVVRIFIANLLIKSIVNCGFNTLWITILYGKVFSVILPARALKNLIMLPIDTVIQFFFLTYVGKVINRLGLNFSADRG